MCINATPDAPITADGEPHDLVEEFTYLGSLVAKDNAAQKVDIKARLGKAHGTFARPQPVWMLKQYSLRTMLRLYNSMVKPVLLFYAECWRVVKGDMNKISAFHNRCLRRIRHIFWPNKISNEELYKKQRARMWCWSFNTVGSDGLGISLEWTRTVSPRLPLEGHHLEEESKGGLEQLGDVL